MLKYLPNLVICRVEQILQKMRLPPELVSEKTKIKMKRETGRPENRGQQGTLLRMSLHSKLHRSYNQRRNRKRKNRERQSLDRSWATLSDSEEPVEGTTLEFHLYLLVKQAIERSFSIQVQN